MFASSVAHAQFTTGAVSGRATQGDVVVIQGKGTGISRQVVVGADGNYSITQLPPGAYTVTVTRKSGGTESVEVSVGSGEGATIDFAQTQRVAVVGSAIRALDVKSTESTFSVTKEEIDRIPVPQDVTAVSVLAPMALQGDGRIGSTTTRAGNVPSIGGASPAENAYYINGFNVTNIVNGVAFNQVPFQGIADVQVKTGGYGAEFGRSLGGVISVTTKRGTNEFHGGLSLSVEPESWKGSSVYQLRDPATGSWSLEKRPGGTTTTKLNGYVSGPLIKDKLYGFALVQGVDQQAEAYGATRQTELKNSQPQYLLKLDWNITKDHLLEWTSFSDKQVDKIVTWVSPVAYAKDRGAQVGTSADTFQAGGENNILKYTGWLTNDLTISALYGVGKYSRQSQVGSAACPIVQDRRTSPTKVLGCYTQTLITDPNANDKREAFRLDLEWALGSHTLRAGLDNEIYSVVDGTGYSGGEYFFIRRLNPGSRLSNGYVNNTGAVQEYVQNRAFKNGGVFKTENSAWYVEDSWQITKDILVSAGLRNEQFTNKNADGVPFIKVENTWAPRFGMSWDLTGKAQSKLFANWGRYYIPVYANTNVRLSGSETDITKFWEYLGPGVDATQKPLLGAQLGTTQVTSNGVTPDPRSVVDPNIKPMYQDEIILGFQQALAKGWKVGVKYTHRNLKSAMDDICNDEGALNWATSTGTYTAAQAQAIADAIGHCFLANPGKPLTANVDLDGTGVLTPVTIPAAAMLNPIPKRKYDALEISFERAWDKKWSVGGSYVLAYSKGNTEGYVKSDIGQDDAGISQDWDYPGLMEGSDGPLPNDRRHTFKAWGSYQWTPEWRFGGSAMLQSGRPKNCLGYYAGTLDGVSILYGSSSFYCNGQLNPRGSLGRLPWFHEYNAQVTYTPNWAKGVTLQLDVLNILNKRGVRAINEQGEVGIGSPDPLYQQPVLDSLQRPRTVRFTAAFDF